MAGGRARALYEEQVRALPLQERLMLLALLAADLAAAADAITAAPAPDIMALYGVGKGRDIGMDAQEYINRLREGKNVGLNED
jgi:hypothetical protein